ncbi:MAG: M48 family metalloprotease [Actinomycetota bacterium]|nr:M48 family metalloprotease [Actinomycetota bacterium]
MRSARNLYRVNLSIAALGALAVIAGTGFALGRVDLAPGSIARLLRDCRSFLLPHFTPGALTILGLGLLSVVVFARGLRSASRRICGCCRLLRELDVVGERRLGEARVQLIAGPRVQAFCTGFVRPRVFVSRGATDRLSEAEVTAVVAHETHHMRRRDPLRLLLLAVLEDALFFMPALRRLRRRYAALAELAADEAALVAVGDASHLASALLQFGDTGLENIVSIDAERVDHLLGSAPGWDLPVATIVGALLTPAALLALVFATAASSTVARTSLAQLAAQSCMIAMTAAPILALAGLGMLGRRTMSRSH